ncbi:MAG: hypothetical protein HY681_01615 [Chloroflexi bacterium]|nr:hypothetical protein [Chloroflexota bacterium]
MSTQPYRLGQINILPAEYRQRLLSTLQLALLFVALAGLAAASLALQSATAAKEDIRRLEADQARIGRNIAQLESLVVEANALRDEISELEAGITKLRSGEAQVEAQRLDWPAILSPLVFDLPDGLSLTSLEKIDSGFAVAGVSTKGVAGVERYHAQLTASPRIKKVEILGMLAGRSSEVSFTMLIEAVPNELPAPQA